MSTQIGEGLNLANDTLTLVRVSPDYFGRGDSPSSWSNGDDDSRTFYATTDSGSTGLGDEWALVVVPEDDPRAERMWSGHDASTLSRLRLTDDGKTYRGWRLRRHYLSAVQTTATTGRARPASADMIEPHQRRALPVQVAYPVGTIWDHIHHAGVQITGHNGPDRLLVSQPSEAYTGEWARGALDTFGTFVGWADDTKPEAFTASAPDGVTPVLTYDQEAVDRLVAEARAAAKREADAALEAFKEAANERAVQYAHDNSLCSEFERCMEDIGLKGREEWREGHLMTYRVRFYVDMTVDASDDDDAYERAREDLYNDLSYPADQSITLVEVEEL